jgi:lipopolysaccharide export system protein LptC
VNKKSLFFTIILLIILSTSSILALLAAKKITIAYTNSTNTPDFFMMNAIYTQFDQNGAISNKFYANKLSHFTAHNNYIFDNPSMKMHNSNEQPWDITATKGESELGKSKVHLWGNVKLVQAGGPNNSAVDITTTDLTIYPNTKTAETNDPITIIQNGSIAKAIGAKTDFKAGVVNFLSNVECQYQAN